MQADKLIKNLLAFVHRYESPEIALNCGIMLRECIRHEPLAKIILWSEQFYDFFRYVEMSTFDIASDAFATFKVIPETSNCCCCASLPCAPSALAAAPGKQALAEGRSMGVMWMGELDTVLPHFAECRLRL